tara:strand:- start:614 stop:1324 length:711 start_codon:yes stop_codon:yes gene_type:complete
MKLIFIELFIIAQLLFGQFPSYNISKADESNFSISIKPLIRSTSFSLGYHQLANNSVKQRFSVSIIFPMGHDLTNKSFIEKSILGLPLIHSSLLVSDNFRFNGKIGGFTSENDVVNYYSYGFSLGLVKEYPNLWILDLSIGKMEGPKYINCRTFDFSITKSNLFNIFPFYIGVGNNQFNSRVFYSNIEEIPKNISGSTNYIMLGKIFSSLKWKISPQIRLNIKFSQFSISFQKEFE